MKNNIGIKTFVRLDQAMIDLLIPHVSVGYHVEKHWAFWVLTPHISEEVETWLSLQPEDSYTRVSYTSTFRQLLCDPKSSRIAIGISLSEVTGKQIHQLLSSRKPLSFVSTGLDLSDYIPTKNPLIYNEASQEFFYVSRNIGADATAVTPTPIPQFPTTPPTNPELAQKFIDSLAGHDFFYDYSDSLAVYKSGKAAEKRLKDEGVAMGISRTEVERLYTEKYKSYLKR
jgi:hypothetical protein